jgi:hypothetical protein
MALYTWNGLLLTVDGLLAASEDCCCEEPGFQCTCDTMPATLYARITRKDGDWQNCVGKWENQVVTMNEIAPQEGDRRWQGEVDCGDKITLRCTGETVGGGGITTINATFWWCDEANSIGVQMTCDPADPMAGVFVGLAEGDGSNACCCDFTGAFLDKGTFDIEISPTPW